MPEDKVKMLKDAGFEYDAGKEAFVHPKTNVHVSKEALQDGADISEALKEAGVDPKRNLHG